MKKGNKLTIKKGWCVLISLLLVLTTFAVATVVNADNAKDRDPWDWDVTLDFVESLNGKRDTAVFGEDTDATDGPPHDAYDVPKAGTPPAPYLYAYFDDNLATPYDKLWKDCRNYPEADDKVWNLSVKCDTSGPLIGDTDITISWDKTKVALSEYNHHVELWNDTQMVADMLTEDDYTIVDADSLTVYNFQIKCRVNHPPTAPVVDVTPDSPLTTDDLLCSITTPSSDPDGDTVTYSYQWYKDDVLQSGETGTTLGSSLTAKGEVWKCVVTPNDGTVDGSTGEDEVTVGNSPPTAPVVDVTPDSPLTTDDLLCSITTPSSDPDGDTVTYSYQWYKDDVLQSGETSSTLSHTLTAKGEIWKCVVTPNDGTEDGSTGEDQVTIGNSPPTAPVVDVTPDSPLTTDDLLCSITTPSSDPDGDTVTYSYQWYKDDVLQSGETGTTLGSSLTAKGEVWKCVVTPNDGTEDGSTGEDQVTIGNSPPTAPVVDVTPDSPLTTDDLLCSITTPSSDPDGDTVTYSYQWYKDDVLQSGETGTTLGSSLTAKGEVWKCVVTPNDGTEDGSTGEDQVTIGNSPPTAPVVDVTPDSPLTTDDLLCSITTPSSDPDGDTVTYSYQWYKDDVLQSGETSSTLSHTLTAKGEIWKCVVTPNDGTEDGSTGEDQVTIGNSPPTAPVVDVTPDSPLTTDDLLCTITTPSSDPDGDTVTYSYQWYKDDVLQSGETGTTLGSSLTAKGEVWKCVVTPNDGTVDGSTGEDEVTVGNSPPTAPVVDVTPDSPLTTDDLLCSITTPSSDPDGDTVTYSYQWYKDDVLQSGETSSTLSHTLTAKGEIWKCVVTPNDGTEDGSTGEDQVTIGNSPPTAPVVDVTPDSPLTTDDLLCSITTPSSDPDGDTVTYSYQWYKDDVLQSGETSSTLSHTLTAKGEIWKCVVTPNDGTEDGSTGEDQVTIGNSPPTAPVVDVTPDSPLTTDDLLCTITTPSSDPDGDTVTYTYRWYNGTTLIQTTGSTGSLTDTLSSSFTANGYTYKCIVTPNDGVGDGPSGEDQVTIGNSPPTGGNDEVTTPEDAQYVFAPGDFTFADVDSGDSFQGIKITSLESVGTLLYDGSDAEVDDVISAADLASGKLTFDPVADENGDDYDSFGFKVYDGSDYSSSAYTMTVDVTGVNDPPVNTVPGPQTINQDTDLIFNSTNGNLILISDIDAGGNDVEVNLTAINGVMNLSSTTELAFSDGDGTEDANMEFTGTIIDINVALDGLKFIPNTGYHGSASVTITTNDQGHSGSGGAKSDTDTVDITVLKLHCINLKHHWNLISLPFNESIDKTDITVRNNSIEYNWTEAFDAGIIVPHLYDWDRTSQTYKPLPGVTTMEPGRGYWMWAYYNCELLIPSNTVGDGYITDLKANWNIMGQPYNTSLAKGDLIICNNSIDYSWDQAVENNTILGFIYGWDRTMQMYELSDEFNPGYGYWMYAYYDCILKREIS